jgi:type I restriction enzyme S subunit
MHEGWRHVVLGEVLKLEIDQVKVDPLATYKLAGVYSFGRGLFERERLLGAKTSYKVLHRLRPGQLVMSKLKAWEGALAVVPEAFDGFVLSPEFPTFTPRDDLDPQFLALVCTEAWFWQILQGQSQGMGGRRERVHPRRLLEVQVLLPPLPAQRRIVDLIAAVDDVVDQAHAERDACRLALAEIRERECFKWERRTLVDLLLNIDSGRSPNAERRPPRIGERGVLKLSAVRGGSFIPKESKAIGDDVEMPSMACLRAGDVLITRSNTASMVGDLCLVDRDYPRLFLSDLILRLHPRLEVLTPAFLVEALLTRDARSQIQSAAMGTSPSMKKISRRSILSFSIPLPALEDQRRIAETCHIIRRATTASDAVARSAVYLRTRLLSNLLAGDHQVPESYDELLEATG